MEYRPATPDDAAAIARLHADSWRVAYRGIYPDGYLDGPIFDERLALWAGRMANPRPTQYTLVADDGGTLAGFANTYADDDETWGALVDNLHAAPDRKGQGIGTRLMAESAAWVDANARIKVLYLYVLEKNTNAQHFYDSLGGEKVGTESRTTGLSAGNRVHRYAWRDLHLLTQLRPA